ncbi:MAG: di-heme oxidoredictase family protein [Planctomycetaceae bacterium]
MVVDDDDPIYERIPEIPFPDDFPRPEEWKTPPLWGVADTAPYMHDGSASTLEQAILAHKGEARKVTKNYQEEIPQADRDALLTFLRTLRTPGSQVAAR